MGGEHGGLERYGRMTMTERVGTEHPFSNHFVCLTDGKKKGGEGQRDVSRLCVHELDGWVRFFVSSIPSISRAHEFRSRAVRTR